MTTFRSFRKQYEKGEGVHFNPIPVRARSIQGKNAGFSSRFIAVLIDMALIAVLVLGAYGIWMALRYVLSVFYDIPQLGAVPLLLIGYFLMWVYWMLGWASSGRTLGNVLMGLRVEMNSGNPLTLGRSALRALFSVAFPIGLAWAVVSRSNHSVQDVALRTRVVFDWAPLIPPDAEGDLS